MKKIFGYMAAALLVAGVSVACDNKEPIEQEPVKISLEVSPTELSAPAARSIETIEVVTDAQEWDFMTTANWIEVEKTEDGLTVEVLENEKTEVRTADIIVFAFTGDVRETATVTVEQAAAVSEGGNEGGSDIGGLDANGNIVFECSEFKAQMVTYYDANGDGEISPAEVANVKDLVVTYDEENEEIFQITSLVGIKYFVNLVNLDCNLNIPRPQRLEEARICGLLLQPDHRPQPLRLRVTQVGILLQQRCIRDQPRRMRQAHVRPGIQEQGKQDGPERTSGTRVLRYAIQLALRAQDH